jgi:hypothetical protein
LNRKQEKQKVNMLGVAELIDRVKKEERLSLTEAESKILLSAYGSPVEIVWTHFVENKYKFRVVLE